MCFHYVNKVPSLDAELGKDEENGSVVWAEILANLKGGESEEAMQPCRLREPDLVDTRPMLMLVDQWWHGQGTAVLYRMPNARLVGRSPSFGNGRPS